MRVSRDNGDGETAERVSHSAAEESLSSSREASRSTGGWRLLERGSLSILSRPQSACLFNSGSPTLISSLLRLSAHHLALAASALQPLKSGILSLHLSVPVPVLAHSVVTSRPTTASRLSNPLNRSPLAPQIRLLLRWPLCAFINYTYLITYLQWSGCRKSFIACAACARRKVLPTTKSHYASQSDHVCYYAGHCFLQGGPESGATDSRVTTIIMSNSNRLKNSLEES